MRTTRPRCLLVDANIVIETHKLKVWEPLCHSYEVAAPSIVIRDEARIYFKERHYQGFPILLQQQVKEGSIKEWEISKEEKTKLLANFDAITRLTKLDPGEIEALACLNTRREQDVAFSTADKAAIQALAMLDMTNLGLSLEAALKAIGLNKTLTHEYRDDYFQKHLKIGFENRLTGKGLSPDSRYRIKT